MANFSELIRKFDKIRDYMRDFYIYGFKPRDEFTAKSLRTYDNEKRRIESYMGEYMRFEYNNNKKISFISLDCSKIFTNPLYAAWKSKAFTDNDIMLHFYILDILKDDQSLTIDQITNYIIEQSDQFFDIQTVRNKCKEYIELGILDCNNKGKTYFYSLSKLYFDNLLVNSNNLVDAIKFFQGSAPLGIIGSYILDNENLTNDLFTYKHQYIVHTLDDEILLNILKAIRNKNMIEFINKGKRHIISTIKAIPLKLFVSTITGRRYLCVYLPDAKRFFNYRLDNIRSVTILNSFVDLDFYNEKLNNNLNLVWGVGFGKSRQNDLIVMKLFIDEVKEKYILERISREGHHGTLIRIEENIFLYQKEMFDSNDISPWIKTFVGRIIELEGTNQTVIKRFYDDINALSSMYFKEEE